KFVFFISANRNTRASSRECFVLLRGASGAFSRGRQNCCSGDKASPDSLTLGWDVSRQPNRRGYKPRVPKSYHSIKRKSKGIEGHVGVFEGMSPHPRCGRAVRAA